MILTFYRDAAGERRWRLTSRNGRLVAASSEGYRRAVDCRANARLVLRYRLRPDIRVRQASAAEANAIVSIDYAQRRYGDVDVARVIRDREIHVARIRR